MKRLMIIVSTGDSHTPATCPWNPTVIIQLSPVCLLPPCNSPIRCHRFHMPGKTKLPYAPRWILLKPNGRWTSDGKPPWFEANLRNLELVHTKQSGTCLLRYLWKTMLDSCKPNSKRWNYELGLTTHYRSKWRERKTETLDFWAWATKTTIRTGTPRDLPKKHRKTVVLHAQHEFVPFLYLFTVVNVLFTKWSTSFVLVCVTWALDDTLYS